MGRLYLKQVLTENFMHEVFDLEGKGLKNSARGKLLDVTFIIENIWKLKLWFKESEKLTSKN